MKKKLLKTLFLMSGLFTVTILTTVFSGMLFAANSKGQSIRDVKVSVEFKQTALPQVLSHLEEVTEFQFQMDAKIDKLTDRVTLKAKDRTVAFVLEQIARQTGLSFQQLDATVIVVHIPPLSPESPRKKKKPLQDKTITGKVTDADGEPLAGAGILIKGTTRGTVTDLDGNYVLKVPDDATTLVFSFIGYLEEEVDIAWRSVIDIVMQRDLTSLDEVVVIGYGEQSKRKLTSSVTKLTSQDIENLPVTSFDQALQGMAPGVHVASTSGAPGSPVLIRIRGANSINARNDPLFVVDGVPIISGNLSNGSLESVGGPNNILSSINPDDIASIEILKDAAATAIYGSRAANGVVLVTTKQGRGGETNIKLSAFTGIGQATELLDMLNTQEYLEIKREAFENDGLPIPADLLNVDSTVNTDWQDEIFRTANISQYQLSLDGGNDKTQFYISAGLRNEQAILKNAGLTRGNFRINLDHLVNDKLQMGTRIALSREQNDVFTRNAGLSSPAKGALVSRPDIPVRDSTGEYTVPIVLFGTIGWNPVAELLESKFENLTSKALSSIYFDYQFIDGFRFRADMSYDYNVFQQDLFYPSSTFNGLFTQGSGFFALNQSNTYNIEPTIHIEKTIGQLHNITSVVGGTLFKRVSSISNIAGINFVDDELTFLISAGNINNAPATQTTRSDYAFNSLFIRANYDYKGKYLLSGTIRRDGSSRFGDENRFGTFWAISGGWLFSEESFLSNSNWLTFGKLRASYGITGNDQIGDFVSLSRWTTVPGYGNIPGLAETSPGNPELGWEETTKLDFGIELAFIQDRIRIEADYFINRTKDLLFNRPLSGVTGFQNLTANIGEIENQGFELAVSSVNVSSNNFSWNSSLNITRVNNEIISLVDDEPIITATGGYIVGESINIIRGFDFLGIDPETGDALYRDVSNDGQINFTDDAVVIGNTLPDFFGGFTNTFSWKGLSLDVFLQFVKDAWLIDGQGLNYLSGGISRDNQVKEILNRWQKPGDVTDIPRVTTRAGLGLNNAISDRFIWDASYLRIKNVTLSYQIPQPLSKKAGIENARIYLTGTNLYTFTDYPGQDPEATAPGGSAEGRTNGNLPQVKMFLMGVNLTF